MAVPILEYAVITQPTNKNVRALNLFKKILKSEDVKNMRAKEM